MMGTFEDPIKSIFFEKQVARLCAQHALNMLLQKDLFSPVDLAEIAGRLDREENEVLDAGHKESQNMDDSGFFSVQVITEALKTFKLDLVSITHPGVADIKANPLLATAFICNRSEHWFVIRKFGPQWFELNSCRDGPLLHTDTYVSLYLNQLTQDGYSIFVINGDLPECKADHVIAANPVKFVPPKRKEKKEEEKKEEPKQVQAFSGSGARLGDSTTPAAAARPEVPLVDITDDDELEEAIRRSLADQEAAELAAILELSLSEFDSNKAGPSHSTGGGGRHSRFDDDLKRAMELSTEDDSEDRSFQMALAMSMETEASTSTAAGAAPAPPTRQRTASEEMRAKREAFLNRLG